MDNNELISAIVDALIWPLTLIGLLLFFREVVKKKLLGLQSAKFSAEGGEVIFKKMKKENKENSELTSELEPKGRSLSPTEDVIKPGLINASYPPKEQLFMINSKLEDYLKRLAESSQIPVDDFESLTMIDTLTDKGLIDLKKRDKLITIVKLVRSVDPNLSEKQINIVRKYYENI